MQNNATARCALQIALERRLAKRPADVGPEQDICDITLWLREKFPNAHAHVHVDQHYTKNGREISGLAVTSAREHPISLAPIAHEAFLALGYDIQDLGGDSHSYQPCHGDHSNHEALSAYARIERALRAWRLS